MCKINHLKSINCDYLTVSCFNLLSLMVQQTGSLSGLVPWQRGLGLWPVTLYNPPPGHSGGRVLSKHPGRVGSGAATATTAGKQGKGAGSKLKSGKQPDRQRLGKSLLHPRNRHRNPYDFARLAKSSPELNGYLRIGPYGDTGIDFANPAAVKALNRALLLHFYGIKGWDIPAGYLCPPVPGRADYIHVLADLLSATNGGGLPPGAQIRVLDIGTGANCIYPLLGHASYGWHFVASDLSATSLENAARILAANPAITHAITLRQQSRQNAIFSGIIGEQEQFDLTLCNPPFHSSAEEASATARRKVDNLGRGKVQTGKPSGKPPVLNFGGQANELWCPGGELAFIRQMMQESQHFASHCCWFSSLVSRREHLPALQAELKRLGVTRSQVITMAQGQKQSRMLAWSFLDDARLHDWCQRRWRVTP